MPDIRISIAGIKFTKIRLSAASATSVIQCQGMGLLGFKAVTIVKPAIKNPQLMKIKLPIPKFNIHKSTFSISYNFEKTMKIPIAPPKTVKNRTIFL